MTVISRKERDSSLKREVGISWDLWYGRNFNCIKTENRSGIISLSLKGLFFKMAFSSFPPQTSSWFWKGS